MRQKRRCHVKAMMNMSRGRRAGTSSTVSSTSIQTARSTDPVSAYARAVVKGRVIACKSVVKAAERHLRDRQNGPARGLRWDRKSAEYGIAFFGFLRHSKGELAGQRIRLEAWQKFCIGS